MGGNEYVMVGGLITALVIGFGLVAWDVYQDVRNDRNRGD